MASSMYDQPEARKGHGCFFYGCITAIVLAVLLVAAVLFTGYYFYRYAIGLAKEYTETAPTKLPEVDMPKEERASLHERLKAFKEAVNARKPTEPLVLTADDINALIEDNEEF